MRRLTTSMTKSSSELEFPCWLSLSACFLVDTRRHITLQVSLLPLLWGLQVTHPPDLWARSANLGTALVLAGRHALRGQAEVNTEILDALVCKVPIEMSPGKLLIIWSQDLRDSVALMAQRLNILFSTSSGCYSIWKSFLVPINPFLKKEFIMAIFHIVVAAAW